MIKIVVLICATATPQLECTENTAQAIVMADTDRDDGTPCKALGSALLAWVHKNEGIENTILVACMKDGKPY